MDFLHLLPTEIRAKIFERLGIQDQQSLIIDYKGDILNLWNRHIASLKVKINKKYEKKVSEKVNLEHKSDFLFIRSLIFEDENVEYNNSKIFHFWSLNNTLEGYKSFSNYGLNKVDNCEALSLRKMSFFNEFSELNIEVELPKGLYTLDFIIKRELGKNIKKCANEFNDYSSLMNLCDWKVELKSGREKGQRLYFDPYDLGAINLVTWNAITLRDQNTKRVKFHNNGSESVNIYIKPKYGKCSVPAYVYAIRFKMLSAEEYFL